MDKKLLSLIIPCYNEEESLPFLYEELCKVADSLEDRYVTEFIFVNDGSKDNTAKELKRYARSDFRVRYISLSRNFGKEPAMYAGFCNAHGDYVAVMDADMQDPPSLLPQMLNIIEEGEYDCVATRRVTRKGEPPVRSFFARAFYKLSNKMSETTIVDGARDFRLMKKQMVEAIVRMSEYNRFSKGIFSWVGFNTCWLPYENVERVAGKTKWSFWKLFLYAIDGFVDFSNAPLAISAIIGIIFTIISFIMVGFIIVRKLIFGDPVNGWASQVCIMVFIGGIQLFCIGIIGEYLSKIYLEVKNRPIYIVGDSNIENVK